VARESTLLRVLGETERSYDTLQNYIQALPTSSQGTNECTPLSNGRRGELLLSYASNLLHDGQTSRAAQEFEAWQPLHLEQPSRMELDIERQRHVMLARTRRNEGHFQEALVSYEALFKDAYKENDSVSSPWQVQTISHLSDMYCEVGRPMATLNILQPELEKMYARNWETTPRGQNLRMCEAEALIRLGYFDMAQQRLHRLQTTFEEIPGPDMLTRTRCFRAFAGLARIAHMQQRWDVAYTRWHQTLTFLETSGWRERRFNAAITLFSLAQVMCRLDQLDDARDTRKQAEACLETDGRQYWLVGLGSYWYTFVTVPLGEIGPDPIELELEERDFYGAAARLYSSTPWAQAVAPFRETSGSSVS